ncbi:MAG: RNA ligase, Rnl2 family [Bacteroidales bacterium]|jgi:Rnl2 family RNA ligase|nr:RNA ligase, Rnl2 family [Bacteroidales bacterium]
MELKKYNSIENSYQLEFLNEIKVQGFHKLEYVVQEKVHGANLSFITNGKDIISAKRTELITDDENFYNSKYVQQNYESKVFQMYKLISEKYTDVKQITIFGELFGGIYPHPNVKKISTAIAVQKGIYYSPDNEFYAFDILVNSNQYLDTDTINSLFESIGFLYAKTLFRGSLNECLEYPNNFSSKISKWLNLPDLQQNICEGVVIRPIQPNFLRNGSRVLIKNKNEKWMENNNFIDKNILKSFFNQQETLSDDAQILCEEILKYITENRLENVISKIGTITPKDYGKLLGLYCKDTLEDFLKIHKTEYGQLEKYESKAINKLLNTHAGILITNYLKN